MKVPGDPERFLRDFHRRHPGCTSQAFANGRCASHGLSSYQLLAELANPDDKVLDLGCGDGTLMSALAEGSAIGLDFSRDELAQAPEHLRVQGRATALPFADGEFTLVLSHLAFHIMSEVESVVRELARVLSPGGRFATIVGGGPRLGNAFEVFLELALESLEVEQRPPRLGDMRARTEAGLAELFSPAQGFSLLAIEDHSIDLGGDFAQVWTCLSTIYELSAFRVEQFSDLETRFRAACTARSWGQRVPCTMLVRRVVARRIESGARAI